MHFLKKSLLVAGLTLMLGTAAQALTDAKRMLRRPRR